MHLSVLPVAYNHLSMAYNLQITLSVQIILLLTLFKILLAITDALQIFHL